MICEFCKHEFSDGLAECPYCHKMVDKVPEKMSAAERDTYDGVTVELDSDGNYTGTSYEGGSQEEYAEENSYGERNRGNFGGAGNSGVHFYHSGGSILWLLLFIVILLAAVFFLLPAFLVIAAIGAVIIFVAGLVNRFL